VALTGIGTASLILYPYIIVQVDANAVRAHFGEVWPGGVYKLRLVSSKRTL
jgi:hypothetical protein